MPKIVSFDPSINFVGYAIAENGQLLKSGLIKSVGDTDEHRLHSIHAQVVDLLFNEKIDRAYVERLTWVKMSRGQARNVSSIVKMSMACAVILLVLCDYEIPIYQPDPKLARKERAISLACSYMPNLHISVRKHKKGKLKGVLYKVIIKPNGEELTDHEADALAIAVFYSRMDTNPLREGKK